MTYREVKRLVRARLAAVLFHEADLSGIYTVLGGENDDHRFNQIRKAILEIASEVKHQGETRKPRRPKANATHHKTEPPPQRPFNDAWPTVRRFRDK